MFHVGTARTALFNWLHCRRTGGTFVLRVEDTDTERNQQAAFAGIESAMAWLGLDWDEGPFFQSAQRDRHVAVALDLAERDLAYWSDPMPLAGDGKPLPYDGRDRDAGKERAPGRALRFRTPREGGAETVVDLVRGTSTFAHETVEDFAILRGNGDPLFLLANVVDDIDTRISHVVRGEDHLTNTAKYQLLWSVVAPDQPHPVFAHLPLLVNEKRQKLSKRRDKLALEIYRDEGYLAETMVSYLAQLGWAPPDGRERLSLDELVDAFRLEDVISSPAFFDLKKLDAFNGDTIRELPTATFVERCGPWLRGEVEAKPPPWPDGAYDATRFAVMAPLVQTRIVRLDEVASMVDFLMLDEPVIDEAAWAKAVKQTDPHTAGLLDAVVAAWSDDAMPWSGWDPVDADPPVPSPIKAAVFDAGEAMGMSRKKTQAPVRVAATGRDVGPPLFEALEVLGRETSIARVSAARACLG